MGSSSTRGVTPIARLRLVVHFRSTARYWGKQAILDGSWQPPKIEVVK